MTASSRYTRAISSEVGDIEHRLRILQNGLEKLRIRSSANARDTADSLGEALSSALLGWSERFRQGAGSLGDQSAAFGKDAARYGAAALNQISRETEQRPLVAVAVALGVGILIGRPRPPGGANCGDSVGSNRARGLRTRVSRTKTKSAEPVRCDGQVGQNLSSGNAGNCSVALAANERCRHRGLSERCWWRAGAIGARR
jgi:ElaB/YqjD/DUF883 family membrane-anchored ribosome-binding protein